MKTIIAGSRTVTDITEVRMAMIDCGWTVTEVVSGAAHGVDQLGEQWARENGIPIKLFPAEWGTLGKSAGFVRNVDMADYADALVAVWDGNSRGTAHMIRTAKNYKRHVYVHRRAGGAQLHDSVAEPTSANPAVEPASEQGEKPRICHHCLLFT